MYLFVFLDQFWPSDIVIACLSVCVSVCQTQACPRDNSSAETRITDFAPDVQNSLVKSAFVGVSWALVVFFGGGGITNQKTKI